MKNIEKRVLEIIEPIIESEGFELVDLEIKKGKRWIVRIFIDKVGGVTVEDCARINRYIGDVMDVEDVIFCSYTLEVSSPGLDRPLRKKKDFERFVGKKVKIKTKDYLSGRRNFKGILKSVCEDGIELQCGDLHYMIPMALIEKANTVYEWKR